MTFSYPPARPQTIGEVLDSAFRIFQKTVVRTLPISVLAVLIGQAPGIYLLARGIPARDPLRVHDVGWIALIFLATFLVSIVHYAMLRRQYAIITGRPTRLGGELLHAFGRGPSIALLLVIQGLAIAFGMILLVIPALYLMVPFGVSWPAIAIEEGGAIEACRRAFRLTRGHWWRVSTTVTVAFVVFLVFAIVSMVFIAFVLQLGRGGDVELMLAASRTILLAVMAVLTPFYSAAAIAIYVDLRTRSEQPAAGPTGAATGTPTGAAAATTATADTTTATAAGGLPVPPADASAPVDPDRPAPPNPGQPG